MHPPRLLVLVVALATCSPTAVRNEFGGIVVEGPLAGPFATPDGVVDALPLLLEQPGATDGSLGLEYCSVIYRRPNEQQWYLSKLSGIRRTSLERDGLKSCEAIDEVRDPASGAVRIRIGTNLVGGFAHSHPWRRATRGFSPQDLLKTGALHWRIVVEGAGIVHTVELLILADGRRYKHVPALGGIYKWDEQRRTWEQIAIYKGGASDAQLLDGKSW